MPGRPAAVLPSSHRRLKASPPKRARPQGNDRHIVSIKQTTARSVQAIKKIAATIQQLSDVAHDVAVAMRQQDLVTQEIARNAGAAAKGTRDVSEKHITEVSNSAVKTGQVALNCADLQRPSWRTNHTCYGRKSSAIWRSFAWRHNRR